MNIFSLRGSSTSPVSSAPFEGSKKSCHQNVKLLLSVGNSRDVAWNSCKFVEIGKVGGGQVALEEV